MKSKNIIIDQLSDLLIKSAPDVISKLKKGFLEIGGTRSNFDKQDIVTKYDHEIGKWIGDLVTSQIGNVYIDSEEKEERSGAGDVALRIDPIDGTKHFAGGIDIFSSVYSVDLNGETLFGMVINPNSEKVYYARKGNGAFVNEKRINVKHSSISESFVINELPTSKLLKDHRAEFEKNIAFANKLMRESFRIRNVGLGSLGICWVSEGAASAYIDLSGTTKLYDVQGPLLIAQEAGAVTGSLYKGVINELAFDKSSDKKYLIDCLLVANPLAYDQIVDLSL